MKKNFKVQIVRWSTYFLFALMVVGFSACDDDNNDDNVNVVSEQDEDFAVSASYSNQAEIEFGELAATRATNENVRAFGEMMVEDHTLAQNELRAIATNLNVAVPDTMDAAHQTLYQELSALSGYQFDSAYIHSQVMDHELAQDIMQTQISQGDNPELVNYATETLPIINQHLTLVLEIEEELLEEGDQGTGGDE